MSPFSRPLLRYGAPATLFTCGLALLAAGWPAGIAWTLIVLSLGWAVQRPSAISRPPDRPRRGRRHQREHRQAVEQRHRAESRRALSGPR